MSRTLAAAAIVALVGCGGSELKSRASATADVIAKARENGAQRCAPRELALAESHHDFALQDLDEGNFHRARSELVIAEKNAGDALAKSPKARCNPDKVAVRVKTPEDSDGDGILDPDDECPQDPEDPDGFEDDDGCPDTDNDKDGLVDQIDKCPNKPEDKDGFEDDDGCPDLDNDADGLADKADKCPDQPEDKDGFEDDDGCPDRDNDKDGIPECPEPVDKCPDQPEDKDGVEDDDGCPDYTLVKVTDKKIELKQTVYFDTAKTTIKRRSFNLLNEVARVLVDNPKIKVRIEGHTDSRGSDKYNLKLSDGRAASVREYLINRGIDSDRMVSKGYGERVPIADNRTRQGRSENRRVEFVITAR